MNSVSYVRVSVQGFTPSPSSICIRYYVAAATKARLAYLLPIYHILIGRRASLPAPDPERRRMGREVARVWRGTACVAILLLVGVTQGVARMQNHKIGENWLAEREEPPGGAFSVALHDNKSKCGLVDRLIAYGGIVDASEDFER